MHSKWNESQSSVVQRTRWEHAENTQTHNTQKARETISFRQTLEALRLLPFFNGFGTICWRPPSPPAFCPFVRKSQVKREYGDLRPDARPFWSVWPCVLCFVVLTTRATRRGPRIRCSQMKLTTIRGSRMLAISRIQRTPNLILEKASVYGKLNTNHLSNTFVALNSFV